MTLAKRGVGRPSIERNSSKYLLSIFKILSTIDRIVRIDYGKMLTNLMRSPAFMIEY